MLPFIDSLGTFFFLFLCTGWVYILCAHTCIFYSNQLVTFLIVAITERIIPLIILCFVLMCILMILLQLMWMYLGFFFAVPHDEFTNMHTCIFFIVSMLLRLIYFFYHLNFHTTVLWVLMICITWWLITGSQSRWGKPKPQMRLFPSAVHVKSAT